MLACNAPEETAVMHKLPPTGVELLPFTDDDYRTLPTLFALLEPQLAASTVAARVTAMRAQGWQCVGAFAGPELVAMAGYSQREHLFSGPVAYVENLVVHPDWRWQRIGVRLMAWIESWARNRGCQLVTLDSYASNVDGRAFFEWLDFEPRGIHFVRELR